MNETELYAQVLNQLFDGIKTDHHDKFKNDRTGQRKFAVENLYPDVILTKKGTKEIDFIVEIVIQEHFNKESLFNKWKPLSESGPNFYLLVDAKDHKIIEKWCSEEKIKARFGTYQIKADSTEIKFY